MNLSKLTELELLLKRSDERDEAVNELKEFVDTYDEPGFLNIDYFYDKFKQLINKIDGK